LLYVDDKIYLEEKKKTKKNNNYFQKCATSVTLNEITRISGQSTFYYRLKKDAR